MDRPQKSIFVIFGGTGDLTKTKLMPALFKIYNQSMLPKDFAIVGSGRTEYNHESYREMISREIDKKIDNKQISNKSIEQFLEHIYYLKMNVKHDADYRKLKNFLSEIGQKIESNKKYLFYLAVKPSLYAPIVTNLGESGLTDQKSGEEWKRIIVEKPFGSDLESARNLNELLQKYLNEKQIYRIDHYLGKESVQNMLAFRFGNGIFEPLWNRNYIDHVEITGAEWSGVGARGGYYDHAGALRDMVQNHLLQILATVAMEPPNSFEAQEVRNEKVKIFEALCPIDLDNIEKYVIRGQYTSTKINDKKISGYRDEEKVDPKSKTETYVALKASIDNWRWSGVPFFIRTGKRLPARVSEVVIHFKKTPHYLFKRLHPEHVSHNKLILRIQPDEGIVIKFGMKKPGEGFNIKNVSMDFHYSDLGSEPLPEAYERLLLDALLGDPTLYARADAVEACWKFINPILDKWETDNSIGLYGYPAGTWGPDQAKNLFEKSGQDWHLPCDTINEEDNYCELQ